MVGINLSSVRHADAFDSWPRPSYRRILPGFLTLLLPMPL
jgi:hypothetical protein